MNRFKKFLFPAYILWAVAVFVVYFLMNPLPIGYLLKPLLGWLLIIFASLGIGRKVITLLKLKPATFLEDICLSQGVGLAVVYLAMLLLGAAGLYKTVFAYFLLIFLIALSGNNLIRWVKSTAEKLKKYSHNRFSFIGALFLIILIVGLFVSFLNSIAPPIDDSGLSQSLATAKRYVVEGGMHNIPYSYISKLPPAGAVLQTLGLLIQGNSTARLMTFLFILLLAVGVYSMTRKFFHRKIALFATTICVSTPILFKLYLIDHPFTGSVFYAFMAFYSYVCFSSKSADEQGPSNSWIILSGIFTGMSLNFGFYAMFIPLVLLVMIFRKIFSSEKDFTRVINSLSLFAVSFIVLILPVLIRNLLYTQNPLFPFFTGGTYLSTTFSGMSAPESAGSFWGHLWPLWHIPQGVNIPFSGEANILIGGGVVFLLLLPGIFLIKEIGSTIKLFLSYTGVYLLIYILAGRQIVLLYSLIPVLSIIAAYIVINLFGQRKYFYQFIISIFFIAIAANLFNLLPFLRIQDNINLAVGYANVHDYLALNVRGFNMFEYINNNTALDSKLLLAGEDRTFYINRSLIAPGPLSREPLIELIKDAGSLDKLIENLNHIGITHILVNTQSIDTDTIFNNLIKKIKLKYSYEDYQLYEL